MWRWRAFFIYLGLSSLVLGENHGPAQPERVIFSNITRNQGMQAGAIRALFQDRKGNHWMATAAGLSRYDGIELSHYQAGEGALSQVPKNIVALAQDVDDSLWLGSEGQGLCRFDPKWGVREQFDVASGLAHNCVTCLQMDANEGLWIGTRGGLNWMDRRALRLESLRIGRTDELEEILALRLSPKGTIWAAVARRGIFRKSKGSQWALACRSASEGMRMVLAPGGSAWAFLDGEGLLEISESGEEVRLHPIPKAVLDPSATGEEVLAIEADAFGDVWLGTGIGLVKYMVSEKRWTRFEHRADATGSLVSGHITSLLADRRSQLWAGSDQGDLSWHELTRYWFPGFSAEPTGLYSNDVNGFSMGRHGGVWIATGKGLNHLNLSTGEITRIPLGTGEKAESYKETLCVLEDRFGRVWAGTRRDGIAMRPAESSEFRFFRHSPLEKGGMPEGAVAALFEDELGQLWAAVMGNGVVRVSPENGGSFERFLPEGRSAEMLFVNHFETDGEHGAWLSTVGGGLWHLDLQSGKLQPLREKIVLQQPLPSNNILDVLRSRNGDLWIGTFGGGLVRLDPQTGALDKFDRWEGRLPDWSACGLAEDAAGMIWVATSAGLLRIDPHQGGVRRFDIQDGLQSSVFRSRSALRLEDGRLVFGGSAGFNLVNPRRLPAESPPPRPILAGLELNGEPVKPAPGEGLLRKPLALTDELRIPFDPRMRFALRYGTVDFAGEGQVWFRFRMEPLDSQWQKGTADCRATYQGLKMGDYQFVVQTSRDGRTWNGATSSVRVVILPPWYHSWWATLLGLTAIVAAVSFLFRSFHRRRTAEQKAEKERIENERNRAEAALARQLQHSMLVEQAVADFRKGLDAKAVFEGPLERLAKHLHLSRCLIFSAPNGSAEGQVLAEYSEPELERVGEHALAGANRNLEFLLQNEGTVILHRRDAMTNETALREWQRFWGDDVASVLAIRTVYESRPNGLLALEVCGTERDWSPDERHLAESIAAHLGLVLAQFCLSEQEASHRRELEEARLKADAANKAKSEFLAMMTHELRTPLNAIIGFSEILDKESKATPEQRESLEIISASAEHLLGVINDVLEMSKLEAGKAAISNEPLEFPKMLRSVHGMLSVRASRKGLRFELIPLNELPETVEVDKSKLRQILVNLIGNAVKFTEKGGVSLRVSARPRAYAPELASRPGRRPVELTFEVLDTGPGISPEELPGLFQKFVQTQTGKRSQEGTGLGLAIAKGFAEMMGGSIEVVSRVGLGTLFTVRLPSWEMLGNCQGQPGPIKPAADRVPAGIRILAVEDQPANRLLLKKLLLRVGCVLEEAEHGLMAVEKWQSFRPDIILMDESMPVMTGTQATRKILAQAGATPPVIISLTANAMQEQREAALAAGCTDFLGKPYKQNELYAMIAKYAPPGQRELRKAA